MSVPRRGRSLSIKKRRNRDKPLKARHLLVAYPNPNDTHCITSTIVYLYALFSYYYCFLNSNGWRLSSTSWLWLSSLGMTPFDTYPSPCSSGSMVSIVTFGKTCSGAKNSRTGTLNFGLYKKDFENLGIVLWCFQELCFRKWRKGEGGFIKVALCISVHQTNYFCATILHRYGTGLSPKSVYFSAGSLTLYKGL
jgi:hypothetical protein